MLIGKVIRHSMPQNKSFACAIKKEESICEQKQIYVTR